MAKRPSLAESLMASLSKGQHVDIAEKIAQKPPLVEAPSAQLDEEPVPFSTSSVETESREVVTPSDIKDITPSANNANIQSDSFTAIQPDGHTVTPLDRHTVKQLNSQAVTPLDRQTVQQSGSETVLRSDASTVRPSIVTHITPQTVLDMTHQTVLQPTYNTLRDPVYRIAENPSIVLEFLLTKGGGLTAASTISEHTNVPVSSVRDALRRLKRDGFIATRTRKDSTFQGFSYTVNKDMCDRFIALKGIQGSAIQQGYQTVSHVTPQTVTQTDRQTVLSPHSQTVRHSDHSSSSFFEEKPTTTKPAQDHAGIDLAGPEMTYWRDQGLTVKQVSTWLEETGIDPTDMMAALRYSAHDFKKKPPERSAPGLLRAILLKNGCYARPEDYKPWEVVRAEQLEAEARELQEARERLRKAELELEFQKVLSDPAAVKLLEAQLPAPVLELRGDRRLAALRKVFAEGKGE